MTQVLDMLIKTISSIREQQGYPPVEIGPASDLVKDLGMTSLDIAQLIAMLEGDTGIDPFSKGVTIDQVSTVSEIAGLYGRAKIAG